MRKLYEYVGTISCFTSDNTKSGYSHVSMILSDINDDDKAPTKLEAYGAIAEYINKIEWTDAEERYIDSKWHFDSNLILRYIEVPGDNGIPAKIITSEDGFISDNLMVFGPQDYIETSEPPRMTMEEISRWNEWKWNNL